MSAEIGRVKVAVDFHPRHAPCTYIAGFQAMTAGYVSRKKAVGAARRLKLAQTLIRPVSNRFWRGYMLAQMVDPDTLRVWDRTGLWSDVPLRDHRETTPNNPER